MSRIRVERVSSKQQIKEFVRLPERLYAQCEQYVPDLESDIQDIFSPQNPSLESNTMQAFLAYRDQQVVGRIIGMVNHNANAKWGTQNVRFGYLEFENDEDISAALLHAVEEWGREQGMTAIEGPLGFSDFDKEGMLVEDFDLMGSMIEIYNPAYYPLHLEALGYTKAVDWVQIRCQVPEGVPAKYSRVAQIVRDRLHLKVRKVSNRVIMGEMGHRVFHLLNEAYAPLFGFTKFTEDQIDAFLKMYGPIADMSMIPIIENEQGELVAAAVTMTSMSHALRACKGRLFPFGWVHLMRSLYIHHEDTVQLMLIAVRPDLQGKGVNALLFDDLIPIYIKKGFKWAETGPQLEDNFKELSQWGPLNPQFVKRRRCFTKLL